MLFLEDVLFLSMLQFDVYFCLTNFTLEDQSRPKLDLMYSCKFANTHSIKIFEKENNQKES